MTKPIPITIDVNETNKLMEQVRNLDDKYLYMPMHLYADKDLINNELPKMQTIYVEKTIYISLTYNYPIRPHEFYRLWSFYYDRYIDQSSLTHSNAEYRIINSNFFANSAKQILMNIALMKK